MRAAILAIGNELLGGCVLNANARYLSEYLENRGYQVVRHLVIGDYEDQIADAIRDLSRECQLVAVTGGLGPTEDDRTRQAVARALGTELEVNRESLERLKANFAARKRLMKPAHELMTLFPDGSVPVPNAAGAADGIAFGLNGCHFICMPGVPAEMRAIIQCFFDRYAPEVQQATAVRMLSFYGIPESDIMERIPDLMESPQHSIGLLPNDGVVRVRVVARSADQVSADAQAAQIIGEVARRVPLENCFSEHNESLEVVLVNQLRELGWQISCAESCTGGKLCDALVSVPGASAVLEYSGVFYHNDAKVDLLGVEASVLEAAGAVSPEVALGMAVGVRRIRGARVGVAITGIAGPDGGTDDKPVGTTYVGIDVAGREPQVARYQFRGNREMIRRRAVQAALHECLKAVRDQ